MSEPVASGSRGTAGGSASHPTKFYNCSQCFKIFSPLYYQCDQSHKCCAFCKSNLENCSKCQSPINEILEVKKSFEIRSSTIEEVMDCIPLSVMTPVENDELNKKDRIVSCPFCKCFTVSCPWKGKLTELPGHLTTSHPSKMFTFQDCVRHCYETEVCGAWMSLQLYYGIPFLFILKKTDETGIFKQTAVVWILDCRQKAEELSVKIQVISDFESLVWTGKPTPLPVNCDCLTESPGCFSWTEQDIANNTGSDYADTLIMFLVSYI